MTVAVPIEAARTIRSMLDRRVSLPLPVRDLVEFVEQFAMKPLPGMSQEVVAGEIPEVRLADDTLEAEEIGLIRLNGRVYVPETLEAVDVIYSDDPEPIDDKPLEAELRPTAALSFAEALVGYETIARLSDAHPETPGAVVVGFNNPRSSWQLFALLQQAVAGNGQ